MIKRTSMQIKIRTILLLTILLLSLLPLALSAMVSSFILKENNEKMFLERGNSLNSIAENTINSRISQYEQLLSSIINNGNFENEEYYTNQLVKDMQLLQDSNDQIINVYLAKNDGQFIQTSDMELPEGYDFKERDWYIEGVSNPEKRRIERPYQDKLSNEMVTSVFKTVKVNNYIYGVLGMDIKLSDLSDALSQIKYGQNGELIVADPEKSMVVFCEDESKVGTEEPAEYSIWDEIKNKESGDAVFEYEGKTYETVYTTSSMLDWKIILKEPYKDLNSSIKSIIFINALCISILAVISLGIALIFTKKMSNEIVGIKEHIEVASQGKFNIRISKKPITYELALLTDSFNNMMKSISKLINNVDDSIEMVNKNSDEAFKIGKQITESISQVSETISQISQGNVECSENLEDISGKISDLSNSMNNINTETEGADEISKKTDQLTTYGTKMINVIKEKSSVTKSNSEDVKSVVYEVADSIEKISDMNAAISNITSQTNLLALNAAIEAARAGESGKGFAVVADEIGKLAEETGKSAKHIEILVKEIKEKAENAVGKVNETTELVMSQEEVVEQSSEIFDGISNSVTELTDKITLIRSEVIAVNQLKEEVLNKVENLSSIVEETAAGSEEVTASAEEVTATTNTFMNEFDSLKETVDNLKEEVSKFEYK